MTPRKKSSLACGRGKLPFDSNEPEGRRKAQFDCDLFYS